VWRRGVPGRLLGAVVDAGVRYTAPAKRGMPNRRGQAPTG
jgi:hypothetical protein